MFKKLPVLMCILILVITMTACSEENGSVKIFEVKANEIDADENYLTAEDIDMINDFSFEMSIALAEEYENKNFVVSPFSLWMPLAALSNATSDFAVAPLMESLCQEGKAPEDVNKTAIGILKTLSKDEYRKYCEENDMEFVESMYIANALFMNRNYSVNEDFAQTFSDYYQGTVMNVDFESDDAKDKVNAWVEENTDGNIKDIVDRFDPDTVAAIANTIFFKGKWEHEFNESATVKRDFNSPDGVVNTDFMILDGIFSNYDQSYYEDDLLQAAVYPYTNNAGMMIILPKDINAYDLYKQLDVDYFNQIDGESEMLSGKTYLPKFKIETDTMNLMKTIRKLGVPLTEGYISGISDDANDLFISDAYQKAMIEVDEEGTTAAAATIVELLESAVMHSEGEHFELDCNKPFIFILYGDVNESKQILFTGILVNP